MCIGLDLRWCKCRCCNPSSTCLPPSQVEKGLFWLDGNLSSPDEQIPAHPCRCSCSRFACTRLSPLTHRCNSCNGRSTSLPPGEPCLTHLTSAPTVGDPPPGVCTPARPCTCTPSLCTPPTRWRCTCNCCRTPCSRCRQSKKATLRSQGTKVHGTSFT